MTAPDNGGRVAQRRRTRRAIVDATMELLRAGGEPTVNEIAAAADVSRRTVYLHFPTLDQLTLDAAAGLLSVDVDAALARTDSTDPHERLRVLVDELYASMEQSLPLGRKIVKLTVEAPAAPAAGGPRRGYRRVGWLEWALEPVRDRLGPQPFEDLVSALAMVVGWEAFIVLLDVRGLAPAVARTLTLRTAATLVDAALRH
jgi:AcrR family transcriptional regulator